MLLKPVLLPARRAGLVRLQHSASRSARSHHRPVVLTEAKLVLVPTGDGSCDHLGMRANKNDTQQSQVCNTITGEPVALPPTLELPESGTVELGRDEPADLLVPVPTVSGRHALIKVEGDKVTVTDLNSTNGTFLNGQQLNPMQAVALELGAEVGDVLVACMCRPHR